MSERAELRGGPETALRTPLLFFPSELLRSHAALLVGVIAPLHSLASTRCLSLIDRA